jgi:hypothetical protein
MGKTFGHFRDRQQRVRAVVDSVRSDLRGEPRAEIAAELARRLTAAGLPELPEDVEQKAALIADLPGSLVSLAAALVRVVAGASWTRRAAPAVPTSRRGRLDPGSDS